MFIRDIFPPECIKINLESTDKDEAFEELVNHLCQAGGINARKEILDALWEREAKMSTGFQKGIGLPHGKTDAVDSVRGVLGISRKGLDYDALDGEPVYLLFMVVAPLKDSEKHLHLLQRLALMLQNPQFYTDLQAQKDVQGAHKVISKYEDVLIALD